MRHPWLLPLIFLARAPQISAQLSEANSATRAACLHSAQTPLPADMATVPTPKQWPGCDSYKLYAGIGSPSDLQAARRCAISERLAVQAGLAPQYPLATVFGGSAMLTVLYANGQGVEKNLPLAIRFSCESGWAPAEFEARLQHLEALAKSASTQEKFTYCDDITSGFMQGQCTALAKEVTDQHREQKLAQLTTSFSARQHSSYDLLKRALDNYAKAHAEGEIDLSGTGRAMFEIQAEDSLHQNFSAALQAFEDGKLPPAVPSRPPAGDATLNRTYRKALNDAASNSSSAGTVQPDGIRKAERAWIFYRDAWVQFAALRYPAVTRDAWLALLTADRILILSGKSCGILEMCMKGDWSPRPLP